MLGLDPEHPETADTIERYRAYCESVGLDSSHPESARTVDRLRALEWKISSLDPDRWSNIHAYGRALFAQGEQAANEVAAKHQAELHEVFAEYERIAGRRHPDDDRTA
jgi:hypothetical protein